MVSPIIDAADMAVFRADAESLMTLTFTAYAPNGTTTNVDGFEVPDYDVKGTTPGRVKGASTMARDTYTRQVSIGGQDHPVIEGGLRIPVSAFVTAGGLQIVSSERKGVGWELECTSVGPATDPALRGSRWLVVNAPIESTATARRLDVVRLT